MDFKNIYTSQKNLSFLFSLLLHLLVFVIFAFIRSGDFFIVIPEYSIITFSETPEKKQTEKRLPKEKFIVKEYLQKEKEYSSDKIVTEMNKKKDELLADSLSINKDTGQAFFIESDNSDQYLKLAQSLLDTFLVRNPAYAKMILKEQAKGLGKKKFAKATLVKRLNEELHKYIQKNYPVGSGHAINQYTGPGLQIPLDKLIDLVSRIFD